MPGGKIRLMRILVNSVMPKLGGGRNWGFMIDDFRLPICEGEIGDSCHYVAVSSTYEKQGQQTDGMNRVYHRLRAYLSVTVLPSGQLLSFNPCVWVMYKITFFCKMSRGKLTASDRQPCGNATQHQRCHVVVGVGHIDVIMAR